MKIPQNALRQPSREHIFDALKICGVQFALRGGLNGQPVACWGGDAHSPDTEYVPLSRACYTDIAMRLEKQANLRHIPTPLLKEMVFFLATESGCVD